MFAREKPSALYLVDPSEIRGRIPVEKWRACNAVSPSVGALQRKSKRYFESTVCDASSDSVLRVKHTFFAFAYI